MKSISIPSITSVHRAAKQFIALMGNNKVFAFDGSMGAGKTTLIKAICQEMGVVENITSPTFALINEYIATNGKTIYHFDCYRLKNMQEAFDIGAEEYFYSGNYCFIEWPDRIERLLPEDTVWVSITVLDNGERQVTLTI
jgi:tRNA threonylcarbamoyladenosine biosynthesis protein TsaE